MSIVERPIESESAEMAPDRQTAIVSPLTPRNSGEFFYSDSPSAKEAVHEIHGTIPVRGAETRWSITFSEELPQAHGAIANPGYTGIKASSRPLARALAKNGLVTMRFAPVRDYDGTVLEDLKDPQQLHVDTLGALQKLAMSSEVKRQLPSSHDVDFEKAILIAHSMGALSASRYALANPHRVDSLIVLGGTGFGSPTPLSLPKSLLKRGLGSFRHELVPYALSGDVSPRNAFDFLHYVGRRPSRFIGEGLSCLGTDIRPTVSKLAEYGILTAYLEFERDALVNSGPAAADSVASYKLIEKYGHLMPQVKPQHMAKWIIQTHAELEAKSKRPQAL